MDRTENAISSHPGTYATRATPAPRNMLLM